MYSTPEKFYLSSASGKKPASLVCSEDDIVYPDKKREDANLFRFHVNERVQQLFSYHSIRNLCHPDEYFLPMEPFYQLLLLVLH